MRLVAVDVGNTSTAVGLWSDGRVSRVSHIDGPPGGAVAAVEGLASARGVAGIAYASVVPAKDRIFRSAARRLGLQLRCVSHRSFPAAGLRLDYPHPETIGADRQVGDWNRFHVIMRGEKVTVWLNGELVVDNVTLENYWDRSKPIFPCEQIELQCHGDPTEWRNIFIREL